MSDLDFMLGLEHFMKVNEYHSLSVYQLTNETNLHWGHLVTCIEVKDADGIIATYYRCSCGNNWEHSRKEN